jgi:hypothetical protein
MTQEIRQLVMRKAYHNSRDVKFNALQIFVEIISSKLWIYDDRLTARKIEYRSVAAPQTTPSDSKNSSICIPK